MHHPGDITNTVLRSQFLDRSKLVFRQLVRSTPALAGSWDRIATPVVVALPRTCSALFLVATMHAFAYSTGHPVQYVPLDI